MWPVPKCPDSWHFCDGTILNVSSYQVLYSLIGNIYGGTAPTTFALPDLRGKLPVHMGQGTNLSPRPIGQTDGSPTVTLAEATLPVHSHIAQVLAMPGTANALSGNLLATAPANCALYANQSAPGNTLSYETGSVSMVDGGAAHANVMPNFTVGFIICLNGLFPTPQS
jgi:microcystin-dependent protein